DALVAGGIVLSHRTEDGAVTFEAPARQPGQGFEARFKVIATLAGTLHNGPSTIRSSAGGEEFFAPPKKWTIAERGSAPRLGAIDRAGPVFPSHDDDIGHIEEEAVRDHFGHLLEPLREVVRIVDPVREPTIEEVVVLIGLLGRARRIL